VVTRQPEDDRAFVAELLQQLTAGLRAATPAEIARLRHHFAMYVLPPQPTPRVLAKHDKHVEDDLQWPVDTTPDEYLDSLRQTIVNPRGGIYLAQAEVERTWTIYFVGPVRFPWRGHYHGHRIVVLFNAERHLWITGFQAEAGDEYVDHQQGFWVRRTR
jgi:hypothetical protein